MELTLKQYADQTGISYEAARGSFNRHLADLIEGVHYKKRGRQRVLTDEGVTLMNSFRAKPLTILPGDVARYEERIAELETRIAESESRIHEKETETADLNLRIVALESELSESKNRLIDALLTIQETQKRLLTMTDEPKNEPKKKGFFGRIFGKK